MNKIYSYHDESGLNITNKKGGENPTFVASLLTSPKNYSAVVEAISGWYLWMIKQTKYQFLVESGLHFTNIKDFYLKGSKKDFDGFNEFIIDYLKLVKKIETLIMLRSSSTNSAYNSKNRFIERIAFNTHSISKTQMRKVFDFSFDKNENELLIFYDKNDMVKAWKKKNQFKTSTDKLKLEDNKWGRASILYMSSSPIYFLVDFIAGIHRMLWENSSSGQNKNIKSVVDEFESKLATGKIFKN